MWLSRHSLPTESLETFSQRIAGSMTLPPVPHRAPEMPLVLVAEDNEDNRFIASTMLRHAGYRVIEAEDGASAIDMARDRMPALILMDVSMPCIDGLTAARTLKGDEATRSIVIIAFTAHALPVDAENARLAGCDGYLAKPVEPSRLVGEVAAALSGGASMQRM